MTTRDFTDQTKQTLYGYVDNTAITSGNPFDMAIDWTTDIGIKDDLANYSNVVSEYQRNIIDKNNTTKTQIDQIFAEAEAYDSVHSANITRFVDEMQEIASKFKVLSDLWDTDAAGGALIFQSPSVFAAHIHDHLNLESSYDHALQKQVLALLDSEEFSQKIWDSLDDAGKKDFLERLYAKVQQIMGTSADPVVRYQPTNNSWRAWRGNNADGSQYIVINSDMFGRLDREALMRTIFHETRHVYQFEVRADYQERLEVLKLRTDAGKDIPVLSRDGITIYPPGNPGPLRHPLTGETTARHWTEDPVVNNLDTSVLENFKLYVGSTYEFDAWHFAGQLDPDVFKKETGIDLDDLSRMGVTYFGSW